MYDPILLTLYVKKITNLRKLSNPTIRECKNCKVKYKLHSVPVNAENRVEERRLASRAHPVLWR